MRSGTGHWSGVDSGQACRGCQGQVAGDLCIGRRTSSDSQGLVAGAVWTRMSRTAVQISNHCKDLCGKDDVLWETRSEIARGVTGTGRWVCEVTRDLRVLLL